MLIRLEDRVAGVEHRQTPPVPHRPGDAARLRQARLPPKVMLRSGGGWISPPVYGYLAEAQRSSTRGCAVIDDRVV